MDRTEQIEKYRNTVISAAVIIAALVISYNIYQGNLSASASLKAKISEEEKKNSELEKINKMDKRIIAYKQLLVKREASAVMNDISDMAKGAGVTVLSIKPSQRESEAAYVKDNFDVIVNAPGYNALAKFIYTVESYNSVYIIDSVDINSQSGLKKAGLTANLRISSVVAVSQ